MDTYHIIPDDEVDFHCCSMKCECNPHMKREGDKILIVHSKKKEKETLRDKWIKMLNNN